MGKCFLLFDIMCVCFCFLFSFWGYASFHNSLKHNGQWNATKRSLARNVVGSDEFYTTPQPLSHNHLNLGAWFGFQEIISKKQFTAKEIDFSFSLTHNSYLYGIFNKNATQFSVVRFSLHDTFPNMYATVATDGRFLSKTDIPFSFEEHRRYQARIVFSHDPDMIQVFVDGHLIFETTATTFPSSIGFRNSFAQTSVDTVRVMDDTGTIRLSDDFSYHDGYVRTNFLRIWIAVFLLLQLGRIRVSKKKGGKDISIPIVPIIMVLMAAAYLIACSILSDKYWVSDARSFNFPWAKFDAVNVWSMSLKYGPDDVFLSLPPKTGFRILFLGTSQTWGAGAAADTDTMVEQTHRLVYAATGKTIECVNGGASGSNSTQLLTLYAAYWKDMIQPDLVIINLSNNDMDNTDFAGNLKRFVEINREYHIQTVFILEANSLEVYAGSIENHGIMKQVAEENNIPVIDLHGYLKSQADTGIMWWDYVHLTSYGQALAASYIVTQLQAFAVLPK